MTMTTRHTVPAWLNIDAFDIDQQDLTTIDEGNNVLCEVVNLLLETIPKMAAANDNIDEAIGLVVTERAGIDDLHEILRDLTERSRMWTLLTFIQNLCAHITESSGFVDLHAMREECERAGLPIPEWLTEEWSS